MVKKNLTLKRAIIAIIITNFITAALLIFAPIPLLGGKRLVNKSEYDFVQQFKKLIPVKNIVEENYIEKIDEDKMVEGAIKGMVDAVGDPYTVFMNKKEFQDLMTQTSGSYAGVGIYVGDKEGKIVVIAPIEDSPAEKAGIKSGDIIMKVNDQEVSTKEMDKAVTMMKGEAGTDVKLTILREGTEAKDYSVKRAQIVLKTVKGEMLKDNMGYIRITTFDEHTAEEFSKALSDLKAKNMKGLVLDLRDNPGGLLDQCVKVADELLGEGTVVYTIDNKGNKVTETSDAKKLDVPLTVLVNGGTASASEIVSGAVRDFKAGTLIGTKTFGKGIVQQIMKLGDGTGVKVTMARYYTPSGECIQGKGIVPNIVLDLPKKDKERELKPEEDIQIQKAIEVIKSKK